MKRDVSLDNIRLACNFLVVLIHAYAAFQYCVRGTLEFKFWMFTCNGIGSVAMPALFSLTGYLLFQQYTLASWQVKMLRRVKRLLIPYVCWNLTFVLVYLALAPFVPRLASRVQGFGLDTFWGVIDKTISPLSSPIDMPLWYMRTVFLYALCSPVLLFLLKYLKGVPAYLLIVVYYIVSCSCGHGEALIFNYPAYSLFAFTLGAHLALLGMNPLTALRRRGLWPLALLGVIGMGALFLDHWWGFSWWCDVAFVASIPMMFLLSPAIDRGMSWLPDRVAAFLHDSSFFLYSSHFLVCSMLMHFLAPFLRTMNEGKFTALVFVFVGVGTALVLMIYYSLKRLAGQFLKVWDGTL